MISRTLSQTTIVPSFLCVFHTSCLSFQLIRNLILGCPFLISNSSTQLASDDSFPDCKARPTCDHMCFITVVIARAPYSAHFPDKRALSTYLCVASILKAFPYFFCARRLFILVVWSQNASLI